MSQFWDRAKWLSDIVIDFRSRGPRFKTQWRHCVVSLSKAFYPLLSPIVTQEDGENIPTWLKISLLGWKYDQHKQTITRPYQEKISCRNTGACLKWLLSERPKIGFQDQLLLNAGQKYCRMLLGEHSAILLTFIKLPFVLKIFVLSIFSGTDFTVCWMEEWGDQLSNWFLKRTIQVDSISFKRGIGWGLVPPYSVM